MNTVYRWGLAGILCSVMIGFAAPIFAEEAVPPALTPEDEAKIGAFFEKEEGAGRMYKFFKSVEISGFVDTYYEYNFSNPTSNLGSGGDFVRTDWLESRGFDRDYNSFVLDNIEISVFKKSTEQDPIGFGFTTNYGEIARRLTFVPAEVQGNARVDNDDFTVSQGFVTYKAPVGKGIDFKFGKFATWIGAELWESVDNPNFSRSLLYQNAIPFTNTGLSVSYPVLDNLTTTFYLVNGWDTFVDNNDAKTIGYQSYWTISENMNFIVNGVHGCEQDNHLVSGADGNWRHFWDVILAFKPFEKTAFNINFDFGTEEQGGGSAGGFLIGSGNGQWWGVSGIVDQEITDYLGVAFRAEYLDDHDGARLAIDEDGDFIADIDGFRIWEVTATLNLKIRENLLVRPEIRYDYLKNGQDVLDGQSSELTAAFDVAYMF